MILNNMNFNNKALIFVITISISFLFACNNTRHKAAFIPQTSSADKVILYIYRPPAMSNIMYSPDLYINDEFKFSINNGKNTRISLMPGDHMISIDHEQHYDGDTSLSVKMLAGNTYYIRVSSTLKISSTTNYQPYQRHFNLSIVDASIAINEISDCCLALNTNNVSNQETSPERKSEESGFSVDKTQNPFSH